MKESTDSEFEGIERDGGEQGEEGAVQASSVVRQQGFTSLLYVNNCSFLLFRSPSSPLLLSSSTPPFLPSSFPPLLLVTFIDEEA